MKKFIIFVFCLGAIVSNAQQARKGLKTIFQEQTLTALDGTQISLADAIAQHAGKVIYIDFWASWCAPCKEEMPHSKKLAAKLKTENVVFMYLSIDSNNKLDAWKNAVTKLGIETTGIHYQRDKDQAMELLQSLYIMSIPHYIIIGKDGIIVERDALPPSSSKKLEALLKKLAK